MFKTDIGIDARKCPTLLSDPRLREIFPLFCLLHPSVFIYFEFWVFPSRCGFNGSYLYFKALSSDGKDPSKFQPSHSYIVFFR
jgi:hypothetical protein